MCEEEFQTDTVTISSVQYLPDALCVTFIRAMI